MIHLRTLGALDLRDSAGEELRAVLAQPRRVALLAYLALATPRGYHQRDGLLALFWPDYDSERARNALSQAVHFLRRTLGADAILSRNGDAVSLDWRAIWCDAVAFEEALDAGRLADAVGLYGGDLLDGFHIADSAEFERWLETERARLGGRYTKAVETLAGEREAAGDFDGAVAHWRRLASRDPYGSRVAMRLARALAAGGNTAAALQHLQLHERLLREALDIAPDVEVAALVRQLQSGQSGLTHGDANWAPARSSSEAAPAAEPLAIPQGTASGQTGPRVRRRMPIVAGAFATLLLLAAGIAWRVSSDTPPIRSIAVLPLENHSGDSAWKRFADAMHDALITELARYPELKVTSRQSVMQYRGVKKHLSEIARELNVEGVVEGALLREGTRVRVNVQLIHGRSDRHLWARPYTRDLRDILLLQEELAAAIAREVRVAAAPVAPSRPRRARAGPADSAPRELHLKELYLRARQDEVNRSHGGMQSAHAKYHLAIEQDSSFALAYAGLSVLYDRMAFYNFAPLRAAIDSARIMAQRAMQLDSMLPEARTAWAVSLANAGQFAAAEREFERAIQLAPSDAQTHLNYSYFLLALGRGKDALAEAERTMELDPFAPRTALGAQRAALYLITGTRPDLEKPATELWPILKLEPGEPWARAQTAAAFAEEGRCTEARSEIERARQFAPGDNLRMAMHAGNVYWLCGDRASARGLLSQVKRRPGAADYGEIIAALHSRFGEKDSAFKWLERPLPRWTMLQLAFLSATSPTLDSLRSEPRFDSLLVRTGIRGRPPAAPLSSDRVLELVPQRKLELKR